jgi:uncharacterized damage-inducible protein DinB
MDASIDFFKKYSSLVNEDDVTTAFRTQEKPLADFYNRISEEKANDAYAPGKWTLKELMQHMIDTERIFMYRALAISRKETASLPSFDENHYADNSDANRRTWADLVAEMTCVRSSSEWLYKSFNTDMLDIVGAFNSIQKASVKLIGFITIGHVYHHLKVVEEKYF